MKSTLVQLFRAVAPAPICVSAVLSLEDLGGKFERHCIWAFPRELA